MEELKMIIDMVAKLPQLALWVLLGLWAYKLAVVGSIYGVIRLCIEKWHSWATTPKHQLVQVEQRVGSLVINGHLDDLLTQLHRVAGKGTGVKSDYLHRQSITWLREAIDDKIAKDAALKHEPL